MVRINARIAKALRDQLFRVDDGVSTARTRQGRVCEECGTYLKICYMEHDPRVEPVADAVASVLLDLLVVATGKGPSGVNLLLIHGDAE